jgi:glycosyltransferase involved in cell wall biosynthesis/GT2 family glycosyltransferase
MKLLFLTPYLPGPPLFGGARRIHGLATQLATSHQVSLLALVDGSGNHQAGIQDARSYCRRVETVVDDWHNLNGRPKRASQLGSLLTPRSWERWVYRRPALQRALDDQLQLYDYDAVVCEFAFMAGYSFDAGQTMRRRPRLVLDEHNIEYDLLRRTAEATDFRRRAFQELNWRKLKREEVAIWKRFDGCALTSTRDEELLKREVPNARTAVVPNGVDIDGFRPRSEVQTDPKTLLFFGAINYYPNRDGVLHFAKSILPLVRSREPGLRFRVVGPVEENGPVAALRSDGVEVMGFVDDVGAEIAQATVVVVPLRIGGGTRLKILEAMAMGKAIISTRLGAEGIEVEHDKDILLADTAEEFAAQIQRALNDPSLRERLGKAARQTVLERYSWRSSADKMDELLQSLVDPRTAQKSASVSGNGDASAQAPDVQDPIKISALVCTRNRPKQIASAVRSLLADAPEIELIVVDQSPGDETQLALGEWRDDPRLVYHHSTTTGKGAGLNVGLRMAKGSLIALTDDDCEVPPGWASTMAQILESQPNVAVLFCNVVPVPYDRSLGYVPVHERTSSRLLKSVDGLRFGLGLGAGMAVRRDVALAIGGFDESFGPGARFPSADEWDMCIRVLLSGWHVYETPEIEIVHDGFRSFAEGRVHARRDWIALGAVCAKPLRSGHLRAAIVPLYFFPAKALWPPLSDVLHLRLPRSVGRISAFLSGFVDGLRIPVDPETLRFESPSKPSTST